jgi:hypothetical protein
LDGNLLDFDDQADLAKRELDDLLEQRDPLSVAGVETPQLGGSVVADQSSSVGGALQRVIVDDDKAPVRGQVDVAFDQVTPRRDGRTERAHRVLGVLGRISAMTSQERASVVVGGFVAIAYRLSQAPVMLTAFGTQSGVQQLLSNC